MTHRYSPHVCRRDGAFSLVELLVVIGIIAILITLAVTGFKVVGRTIRERLTNNQLENCKSLLGEYENTNTLDTLLSPAPVTALTTATPSSTDRWLGYAAPTNSTALNCEVAADSSLIAEDTARIIARLKAVPKNRESIEKMPADHIQAQTFALVTVAATFSPAGTLPAGQAIVLLDGNGHPIYFVPGGGLINVKVGFHGGDPSVAANYDKVYTAAAPLKSPDGRPFWVSPGPDGDLTTGDDNIYSFGQ